MIKVEFDTTRMDKIIRGLRSLPQGAERAAARSINRTLVTARKELSTRIREDYNVKAGAIKEDMKLRKATFSSLEGSLSAEGGPGVQLIDYKSRAKILPALVPSTTWRGPLGDKKAGPQDGILLSVRMGQRHRIRGSFVNRMKSGHVGVFRQVPVKTMRGSNKPAIRELYGPSAARILTGGRYQENIEELANATMENKSDSWLPVQEWALRMRGRGKSVLLVHHDGKAGQQRGSSRKEDVLDTVVQLIRPNAYTPDQGAVFEVHFRKNRGIHGEDAKPFEARLTSGDGAFTWQDKTLEESNQDKVEKLLDQGYTQKDIAEELNLSRGYTSKLIKKIKNKGQC